MLETTGRCRKPNAFQFKQSGQWMNVKPVGDVEIRLADDGEILVRGSNVMKGYFRRAATE